MKRQGLPSRTVRLFLYLLLVTSTYFGLAFMEGTVWNDPYAYASPGGPILDSMDPSETRNNVYLNVDIYGYDLENPMLLRLTQNNRVIPAQNIQVVDYDHINCDFDFRCVSPGEYDLEIVTEQGQYVLSNPMLIKGSGNCGGDDDDDDDDDDNDDDNSLAVSISSFGAQGLDRKAQIQWSVSGAEPYAGWNLYRAQYPGAQYEKINPELIPSGLSSYDYVDTGLKNDREYCYVLESVELNSKKGTFGPECVTPLSDSGSDFEQDEESYDDDNDEQGGSSDDNSAASGCSF